MISHTSGIIFFFRLIEYLSTIFPPLQFWQWYFVQSIIWNWENLWNQWIVWLIDWLSKAFWMIATKLLHMFYHNKAWLEQSYLFNNKQTNLMIIKKNWKVFIYWRTLYAYAIIIQTKHMNEVDYMWI